MNQKNDNYIIMFWEPKPALRGGLGITQISRLQHVASWKSVMKSFQTFEPGVCEDCQATGPLDFGTGVVLASV